MEDVSFMTMVVTAWEIFGWLSVVAAILGLIGLFLLWRGLRSACRKNLGAWRLFWSGIAITIISAIILTPFVPMWTMAPMGGLKSIVDILAAFGMALFPSSLVGVLWVYLGSLRPARKTAQG